MDRRARIEAVALGALAAAPLVPYFAYLAGHPAERFALLGDYARLELDLRHVGSGTLLGAYSRFRFAHPGPLWSFLAWPVYALAGRTDVGLYAAACAINAATLAAIAGGIRALSTRAHALGAVLVLLAWVAAFGDTCVLPWNPLTVVLPLLAFLVFAAALASGDARGAPPAALFGALALEVHISTGPTVVAIAIAAVASFVARLRRARPRAALGERDRRAFLIAGAVLFAAIFPPLVEQVVAPEGNVTKIVRFFLHRTEPYKPIGAAVANWAFATTWLPDRLFSLSVITDPWEPTPMGSGPVPDGASGYTVRVVLVTLVSFAAALAVAMRRRDRLAAFAIGVGLASSIVAIAALRAVIGVDYFYLVFWTAATSTCAWIGVALAVVPLAPPRAELPIAGALLLAAIGAAGVNRAWIAKNDFVPKPSVELAAVYPELLRHAKGGEAIVVHVDGAWQFALGALLELTKDGADVRVAARDQWILGRQTPPADAAPRALHVWFDFTDGHVPIARCLEPLAQKGELRVFASTLDVTRCP